MVHLINTEDTCLKKYVEAERNVFDVHNLLLLVLVSEDDNVPTDQSFWCYQIQISKKRFALYPNGNAVIMNVCTYLTNNMPLF